MMLFSNVSLLASIIQTARCSLSDSPFFFVLPMAHSVPGDSLALAWGGHRIMLFGGGRRCLPWTMAPTFRNAGMEEEECVKTYAITNPPSGAKGWKRWMAFYAVDGNETFYIDARVLGNMSL